MTEASVMFHNVRFIVTSKYLGNSIIS